MLRDKQLYLRAIPRMVTIICFESRVSPRWVVAIRPAVAKKVSPNMSCSVSFLKSLIAAIISGMFSFILMSSAVLYPQPLPF